MLGTVQGVGFRPYAFRLATELELGGWILNDERGVLLEVEGPPAAVDGFLARLPAEAPPLATVEAIDAEPVSPAGERGFRILESDRRGEPAALVAPDTATCGECLAEPGDDRREHRIGDIGHKHTDELRSPRAQTRCDWIAPVT